MRIPTKLTLLCLSAATALAVPVVPVAYNYEAGFGPAGWAYPDSGGELTNGLLNGLIPGGSLATPDASQWVGFEGHSAKMTFDFSSVVTIRNVTLDMAHWTAAAVYLPESVTINSTVFTVDWAQYANLDRAVISLDHHAGWTGTQLSVSLNQKPGHQWLFVDEVSFDSAAKTAPQSGPTQNVPDSGATGLLMGLSVLSLAALRRRVR